MDNDVAEHSPSEAEQQVISTNSESITCPTCGKLFVGNNTNGGLRSNYNRHLLTHSAVKPYSCTQCDSSFTTSSNLKRHVQRRHPEAMSEVLATMRSSSRAPTPTRRTSHQTTAGNLTVASNVVQSVLVSPVVQDAPNFRSDEPREEKLMSEDTSPPAVVTPVTEASAVIPAMPAIFGFLVPSPLIAANRGALDIPPLIANKTIGTYKDNGGHTGTPTPPQLHSCPHCEKQFVWRNSLTQHIHLRHREVKEQFVCDACQSVLSSITKLRRHQREHCPFRDDTIDNRTVAVSFVKVNTNADNSQSPTTTAAHPSGQIGHTHRLRGKGKRRREVGVDDDEEGEEKEEAPSNYNDGCDEGSSSSSNSGEENMEFEEYLYSSDEDLDADNKRASTAASISQTERNRRRHQKAKEKKRRRREQRKEAQSAPRGKAGNSLPSSIASLLTCVSLPLSDGEMSDDVDNSDRHSNHSSTSKHSTSIRLSPVATSTVGKHLRSPASYTIRQFPNTPLTSNSTSSVKKETSLEPAKIKEEHSVDREVSSDKNNIAEDDNDIPSRTARSMLTSFICPFIASGCKAKPFSQRRYLMNHMRRSHPEHKTESNNGESDNANDTAELDNENDFQSEESQMGVEATTLSASPSECPNTCDHAHMDTNDINDDVYL